MAANSRKTALKSSELRVTLSTTRLIKLAVEALLPPEKAGKGNLHLTFRPTFEHILEDKNIAVVRLSIKGEGMSGLEDTFDKTAFTIDATIDGGFMLSRKPEEGELKGQERNLANYLLPILVEMIETLVTKCGYAGVLPRSIQNKPA